MITHYTTNLSPSVRATIDAGTPPVPVDLTGATVRFRMRRRGDATLKTDQPATITDAAGGAVQYDWQASDVDTPGRYAAWWSVTLANGRVQDTPEFPINMITHGLASVSQPAGIGPCTPWVTPDEVADACGAQDSGYDFSYEAATASSILYQRSGEQFTGTCSLEARPCRTNTRCWASATVAAGSVFYFDSYGGYWYGDEATHSGCQASSRVLLEPYPVQSITSVTIDGVVIDPSGYRLDGHRWLSRLNDTDGKPQYWPACQDLAAPLGSAGTWSVAYTAGAEPPLEGKRAALELACFLYRQSNPDDDCALPEGTTQVVRQGVVITRETILQAQAAGRGIGLYWTDLFLEARNPYGLRRRARVWSPDAPQPALPI